MLLFLERDTKWLKYWEFCIEAECCVYEKQYLYGLETGMIHNLFSIHNGLATAARFPSLIRLRDRISTSDIVLLLSFGVASSAAVGFIRTGLRLPGNAILLAMIPMVLGLAIAPRRNAGFIMGTGALGSAAMFSVFGLAHFGSGAFVSLCLLGPVLDLVLTKAKSGWWLYAALMLAGMVTNLMAYFSRGAGKLLGFSPGTRPFATWFSQAFWTYMLWGALAGLIVAFCFFQLRKRQQSESDQTG